MGGAHRNTQYMTGPGSRIFYQIPAIQALRGLRKGRVLFPKSIHFREILPMTLKNSVSGAGKLESKAICMNEITVFLACMKKHDFVDAQCLLEHRGYMDCIERETTRQRQLKQAAKDGLLGTGERNLSASQVNKLMQQWPQPDVQTRKHNKRRLPYQSYADTNFLEPTDSYSRRNRKQ